MSRLPKAPLIEVIFELRWKVSDKDDLTRFQYLHGDLYSEFRNQYSHRNLLTPPDIPLELIVSQAQYQFRREKDSYPLIQVGPGLVTLNTDDAHYYWDEFYGWTKELTQKFFKLYQFKKGEKVTPVLYYLDFFDVNPEKNDVMKFVNEKLHIGVTQTFLEDSKSKPSDVNIGLNYPIELGHLLVNVQTGNHAQKGKGLVMQTKITGKGFEANKKLVDSWVDDAHGVCRQIFRKMTEGELYQSFQ